ncbi:MAG: lipocalin-like domain-containing protein, partial [Blastocatellia bacterium]
MAKQTDDDSIFGSAERAASDIFEAIASRFVGDADPLRDGTEHSPVDLPRDLAAHRDAQTEWWYYTGHGATDFGRQFGFELVFFKRRTDLDKFSVVPLRLIGNPFYFAHFAITDRKVGSFRYAHRKSANSLFDLPATASEEHFYLRLGDWSSRLSGESHIVHAGIDEKNTFEATLTPTKQVVLNGQNGVSFKDEGEASRYFSYTRMAMEGDLAVDGSVEHFEGSAWMDREFGTWTPTENQKGWDWFSIQLDNGTELMCYQLRDSLGNPSPFSSGSFVDIEGNVAALSANDFEIAPTGKWISPGSGAEYPSGWNIKIPRHDIELSNS